MSVDLPAAPQLSFSDDPSACDDERNGWGVAWYPNDELGAAVVRDPTSGSSSGVTDVLADLGMLRTALLVAHLRGAAKRANYRDTHPFTRSFASRSRAIAHNGDLVGDLGVELPLPESLALQPIGPTDTEHLLCWLLGRIAEAGAASIEEFGFDELAELLGRANELGTLNLLLTDGTSLLAYRCASDFQPLYCGRFVPPRRPEEPLRLERAGVSVGLDAHRDVSRTMVLMSTVGFEDDRFHPLKPGSYCVAQNGKLVAPVVAEPFDAGGDYLPLTVPSPISLAPKATARQLDVEHITTYTYAEPVERSSHRFRVSPLHDRFQELLGHSVDLSVAGLRYDFEDVFGNEVIGLDVDTPFQELVIAMRASVKVRAPVDHPDLLPRSQQLPIMWMPWQEHMMHSYLLPPELPESELDELTEYARSFAIRNKYELLPTLDDITWTIYSDYRYKPGFTSVETTPYEVFQDRAGVCQDFANLMICLARMLAIPARYRVGYIFTGSDYQNTLQSDASHAWVEAYLPLMGWRGYDPTNGSRVGADHIRVAKGRNYRDATPTSGVIYVGGGDSERMRIDVRVTEAG
jgi:transglutaminase-like putative cysteine protease/predicted glutamine amidotransferase